MDGWELLDHLTKNQQKIRYPIIIVTSSIDPDDRDKAKSHVLEPMFLEKPLTEEKIKVLKLNLDV